MGVYPTALQEAIQRFKRFPGVGQRSAERMVYFVLERLSLDDTEHFARALVDLKKKVKACPLCYNMSEGGLCAICRDVRRDKDVICVVESAKDVVVIEKAGGFKGVYHVLMGSIAPLEGRGPQELTIAGLVNRLSDGSAREVIIATDSDVEGETTALYLTKLIKPRGIKVSRIGIGIPLGGHIEYSDGGTLLKALKARVEL
ncbi:MAG: recombination mediator RecR [Candidatus Omnitrophota bacterium]